MKYVKLLPFLCLVGLFSCNSVKHSSTKSFTDENIQFAQKQIGLQLKNIDRQGELLNPVTVKPDSTVFYCDYTDWRSGFFPGSVWLLYELTGDKSYIPMARRLTSLVEEAKNLTWHHDVGFIIMTSYGNQLRLTADTTCKSIIVQAARSLMTRFRPKAGIIQSWNADAGWQAERGWKCPVIIDNMMNLALLFEATHLTGDSSFYKVAVSHADRTLKEHFHPDGACYHVVDYDPVTGEVRSRQTAQGYSDESVWSRGQAWAIYGFAHCYKETGDRRYLEQALKTFRAIRDHKNMPSDKVPYWDFDAPGIPNEPRDASAAACIASALYYISTIDVKNPQIYREYADSIMTSLASPAYRAALGTNHDFLLMHSVGSIPHHAEINVPLNYADYYFLEALAWRKALEKGLSLK